MQTMENYFSKTMVGKSEEELKLIINNPISSQDAMDAARWELEKRARNTKRPDLAPSETYREPTRENHMFSIAIDEEIEFKKPELFSRRKIFFFGFLFTPLFGSILFALNLSRIGKKEQIFTIVFMGLIFTTGIILINRYTLPNSPLLIVFNLFCTLVYSEYYWNKYIGRDMDYIKRTTWKPLLIATLVAVPILLLMLYLQKA